MSLFYQPPPLTLLFACPHLPKPSFSLPFLYSFSVFLLIIFFTLSLHFCSVQISFIDTNLFLALISTVMSFSFSLTPSSSYFHINRNTWSMRTSFQCFFTPATCQPHSWSLITAGSMDQLVHAPHHRHCWSRKLRELMHVNTNGRLEIILNCGCFPSELLYKWADKSHSIKIETNNGWIDWYWLAHSVWLVAQTELGWGHFNKIGYVNQSHTLKNGPNP